MANQNIHDIAATGSSLSLTKGQSVPVEPRAASDQALNTNVHSEVAPVATNSPESNSTVPSPTGSAQKDQSELKHESVKFRTKRITWFNPKFQSHIASHILIQNENGPCALIAIVNTLILNYQLNHNYQVSSGYKSDTSVESRSAEVEQLIKLIDSKGAVKFEELIDVLGSILVVDSSKTSNPKPGNNKADNDLDNSAQISATATSEPTTVEKDSFWENSLHGEGRDDGAPATRPSPASSLDSATVTEIFNLLPRLHEGLNINPNFTNGHIDNSVTDVDFSLSELLNDLKKGEAFIDQNPKHAKKVLPASKANPEVSLFKAYNLSIYHGWIIDPVADFEEYKIITYLQNFDVCQNFLIYINDLLESKNATQNSGRGEESPDEPSNGKGKIIDNDSDDEKYENVFDVEDRSDSGPIFNNDVNDNNLLKVYLTLVQQSILRAYYRNVNNWLNKSGTQLTNAGIANLKTNVEPDTFVIFFRNDHFSTLFKRTVYNEANEKGYELYSLVTDEGLANFKHVVWQELKSVNGFEELFYDRNFIPVDLAAAANSKPNSSSNHLNTQITSNRATKGNCVPQSDFAAELYKTGDFYGPAASNYDDTNEQDEDFRLAQKLQEREDAYVAKSLQKGYQKQTRSSGSAHDKKNSAKPKLQAESSGSRFKGSSKSILDKTTSKKSSDCVIA